jgi:hypothetical protein
MTVKTVKAVANVLGARRSVALIYTALVLGYMTATPDLIQLD